MLSPCLYPVGYELLVAKALPYPAHCQAYQVVIIVSLRQGKKGKSHEIWN
jgi:hypothetical protein